DWNDGTVDTLPGSATTATHVYADGLYHAGIVATAVETLPLTLIQWPTANGGNGHYYAVSLTTSNWLDAEAQAVSLGGHLVTITSQAEQTFIENHFLSGGNGPNDHSIYWIGLNDAAVEGTFVWSSGETFNYTNWQAGEPSNTNNVEDYVGINWHFGN